MRGRPGGLFCFSAIDLTSVFGQQKPCRLRGLPDFGSDTKKRPVRKRPMAAGQHKLSRRALLAGACALPLSRHAELVSASSPPPPGRVTSGTLKQVQGDDGVRVERWREALARFNQVDRELEALGALPEPARLRSRPRPALHRTQAASARPGARPRRGRGEARPYRPAPCVRGELRGTGARFAAQGHRTLRRPPLSLAASRLRVRPSIQRPVPHRP